MINTVKKVLRDKQLDKMQEGDINLMQMTYSINSSVEEWEAVAVVVAVDIINSTSSFILAVMVVTMVNNSNNNNLQRTFLRTQKSLS